MQAAYRLATAAIFLLASSCAARQNGTRPRELREGTYRVVSRSCTGAQAEEATCERIRYIEIVRGKFYGVRDDDLAIIEWIAVDAEAGPYTYNARRLRGRAQENQYVIDETNQPPFEVREWFVLEAGQPSEYKFRKRPAEGARGDAVTFNFKLSPVARDATLTERMPYPPPVTDE